MAPSETSAWVGSRIHEARERLGISQEELAKRLRKTQTAVSYWETGKRSPKIDDLLDLASILQTDVTYFLPQQERGRPVRAVLTATAERLELRRLAVDLERALDAVEQLPRPIREIEIVATQPVEAARELLRVAGVTPAPVDISELVGRCGVVIAYETLPDAVSGAVIALDEGAVIAVGKRKTGSRLAGAHEQEQRFLLAHHLGHYLLKHHDPVYLHFSSTSDHGEPPGHYWRRERDANEFAAEILMPAASVTQAASDEERVECLADRFGVSPLAMAYRLINLGLR